MIKREVEDVAELMQHIQSRMLVTEAACTSLLSKSWLHAWSTTPFLRFRVHNEKYAKSMEYMDRTLIRYHRDNIPIETFQLLMDIKNQESASHAENWIKSVVTKPCLKELSLSFYLHAPLFTLPDEILSSQNLMKIRVSSQLRYHPVCMSVTTRLVKCVSLQELHLDRVRISEEELHDILSSCTLLVKIKLLRCCNGFKTIKVKNLHRLYDLTISEEDDEDAPSSSALEISHLPFNTSSISIGCSMTELTLGGYGMVTDNASLEMIGSRFPFLESLTLGDMTSWKSKRFRFTCASIKRLSLHWCQSMRTLLTNVKVHAPKLTFFSFDGDHLPSLLFPVSTLEQMIFSLKLDNRIDAHFYLKMREALTLSRKCDIYISAPCKPMQPVDIDDLRTRLTLPPAMNVHKLQFGTIWDECMWERSPFFDALFEIFHPKYVYAEVDMRVKYTNHFCRVMLREVLEKQTKTTALYWAHYLEHVRIRKSRHQKWEALTDSHKSLQANVALTDMSAWFGFVLFCYFMSLFSYVLQT
ncbi:hypothetical protein OROHE_024350 [Orobanche hederae]